MGTVFGEGNSYVPTASENKSPPAESISVCLFKTIPPPPVPGLAFQKRAHGAQITLMAQEIRAFVPPGPELDGVGEGVHGLAVAADEGAAEVNVLRRVFFRLQVGDLADVVAMERK